MKSSTLMLIVFCILLAISLVTAAIATQKNVARAILIDDQLSLPA